jgi:hypothetical protein
MGRAIPPDCPPLYPPPNSGGFFLAAQAEELVLVNPPAVLEALSKAPQANLLFWLVKICATTVGETGGRRRLDDPEAGLWHCHADLHWLLRGDHDGSGDGSALSSVDLLADVVATTTVGTTTSDFIDRTLHVGYVASSAGLLGLVVAVLLAWRWAAFILTRPLGATVGDTFTKVHAQGGLEFGRITATRGIAAVMIVLTIATPSLWRPAVAQAAEIPAAT